MSESQFYQQLKLSGIDGKYVCFNDSIRDDIFCVRESFGKFEVFYRERGKEYDLMTYRSFFEVIDDLKKRL